MENKKNLLNNNSDKIYSSTSIIKQIKSREWVKTHKIYNYHFLWCRVKSIQTVNKMVIIHGLHEHKNISFIIPKNELMQWRIRTQKERNKPNLKQMNQSLDNGHEVLSQIKIGKNIHMFDLESCGLQDIQFGAFCHAIMIS